MVQLVSHLNCPPIQIVLPFNWSSNSGPFVDEAGRGPPDAILALLEAGVDNTCLIYAKKQNLCKIQRTRGLSDVEIVLN